jgi:hypothetical protein
MFSFFGWYPTERRLLELTALRLMKNHPLGCLSEYKLSEMPFTNFQS